MTRRGLRSLNAAVGQLIDDTDARDARYADPETVAPQ
jgi:hypothetical protein